MTTAVTLIGNVTREPEIKYLPSGVSLCEFGIAVNFEEMVRPAWLDEKALDVMEARQREQTKG